jgi:hypothetical protein
MIIFLSVMKRRDALGIWEDYIEVVPDESG